MNELRRPTGRGPARSRAKERMWRQHVERQRRSKLTIRQFCARARISEPSFYAWRSELGRRDASAGRSLASKPKALRRTPTSTPRFVPVTIGPQIAPHVELACASGLVIRVPARDTAALQAVLEHLEPRRC
jgi:hypothetical protein